MLSAESMSLKKLLCLSRKVGKCILSQMADLVFLKVVNIKIFSIILREKGLTVCNFKSSFSCIIFCLILFYCFLFLLKKIQKFISFLFLRIGGNGTFRTTKLCMSIERSQTESFQITPKLPTIIFL